MNFRNFFTIATLLLASGCGSDTGPGEVPLPRELEMALSSGVAGGTVALSGLEPGDFDFETAVATLGSEPVHLLRNDAGELRVSLPFFFDETTRQWTGSPEPLFLEIRAADGTSIARSKAGVAVSAPAPDPGACARTVDVLQRVATSLEAIAALGDYVPGEEDQALALAGPLLRAFLEGDEEGSLTAIFGQLDESDLALFDAALGATGYPEEIAEVAAVLEELQAVLDEGEIEPLRGKRVNQMVDFQLAALMQMSVFAKRYGDWYLQGIASDLGNANTGVSFAGMAGLLRRAPVIGQVFATATLLVSAIEFVMNKHLLATLPTEIDAFELRIADTSLEPGQLTASLMEIKASNVPPAVTANDYIAQLLNVSGQFMPADASQIDEIVLGISSFLTEQINNALGSYASQHPEILAPAELYRIPEIQWQCTVTSPHLVELRSLNTSVVAPEPGDLDWRAAQTRGGSTSVYAVPSLHPDAIVLESIAGIIDYNGGAFGEDVDASNSVELTVEVPLLLETDFASVITPGGANALEVRAGYDDGQGGLDPQAGVQIQLSVDGGTVDESSGVTDADGSFITLARLSGSSQQITIDVTATDSLGVTATASVSASTGSPLANVERHSFVAARTRIDFEAGLPFDCDDADDTTFVEPGLFSTSNESNCSAEYEGQIVELYAMAQQTSDLELQSLEPSLPVLLRATGTGTVSNTYSTGSGNTPGTKSTTSGLNFVLEFTVASGPLQIDYDCLAGISSPIPGGSAYLYLQGPGSGYVFESRMNSGGGGAFANGSALLEEGDYTFYINLSSSGHFSEFDPVFRFDVEIKYPE